MPRSEAQRRADKKYRKEAYGTKYKHFGLNMPISDAELFVKATERANTTPHAVLLAAARDFIAAHPPTEGGTDADAGNT